MYPSFINWLNYISYYILIFILYLNCQPRVKFYININVKKKIVALMWERKRDNQERSHFKNDKCLCLIIYEVIRFRQKKTRPFLKIYLTAKFWRVFRIYRLKRFGVMAVNMTEIFEKFFLGRASHKQVEWCWNFNDTRFSRLAVRGVTFSKNG